MRPVTFEPARPLDTDGMPWIPTRARHSARCGFAADGWSELMRVEPGSTVPLHRHSGDVHAFNVAGAREILGTGERVGPGNYVYEPAGTIDGRATVGDKPCVIYLKVKNPGLDEDFVVATDSITLTEVHCGRLSFRQAAKSGRLTISEPRDPARAFPTWGGLSYYAKVRPARKLE